MSRGDSATDTTSTSTSRDAADLAYRAGAAVARRVRRRLEAQAARHQLRRLARVGPCRVNGTISIGNPAATFFGDDVCANRGLVVRGAGALHVGAHVHFGEHVLVLTANHVFDEPRCLPYDETRAARDVRIGDCCWIGDRVTIVPGAELGEGCVVAAGAVVSGTFPAGSVLGGVPARVLRTRDLESYRRLREEGRYLNWPYDGAWLNGRRYEL